jgi:hypothetical protein
VITAPGGRPRQRKGVTKTRIHALVLGPWLEDGYAGSLIDVQNERAGVQEWVMLSGQCGTK